jgi:serine/threonine protein phosphatase PrpC
VLVERQQECDIDGVIVRLGFDGHSDRGAVRKINEDSFVAAPPVFLVADGMGGHLFGDRASQAVATTFADTFATSKPIQPAQIITAIEVANRAVLELTAGDEYLGSTSGTTLTGLALVTTEGATTPSWMAFNIGDSRTYSWNGRHLVQLSVDHSAVQELVDLGQITRLEADHHPDRNIVTRAIGADDDVDADVWLIPVAGRQTFLLCSDGLTKELTDDEIARIIVFHHSQEIRASDATPITLAERLVSAAIAAGGSDNVTVVIVESELVGSAPNGTMSAHLGDDTIDRGAIPEHLEETRPRG